jgi:hypothetical protein
VLAGASVDLYGSDGAGRAGGAVALALLCSYQGRAVYVLACAARSRPRAEVRGGQQLSPAAVAGGGQRCLLCLACMGLGC